MNAGDTPNGAAAAYRGWALVEQMGFRQTVAWVSEVEQYGTRMLRLDVPIPDLMSDEDWAAPGSGSEARFGATGNEQEARSAATGKTEDRFVTRFAGGPSLYQVTPLSADVARAHAERMRDPRPVRPVDYRLAAPEPAGEPFGADEEDV